MVSEFLRLHGLTSAGGLDLERRCEGKTAGSPLLVPVGFDDADTQVALDFSRFGSLDDHVLVVSAPRSGNTNLLMVMLFGLTLERSDSDLVYLVVDSKQTSEFQQITRLPNCLGAAECKWPGSAERLAQWVMGEVERREAAFGTVGVDNLSDYRLRVGQDGYDPANAPGQRPLAEFVLVIDDITFLLDSLFDRVFALLKKDGHRLGIRMVVGVAQPTWERLKDTGYLDELTARIVVGLDAVISSEVLGVNVSDDLEPPGSAYVLTSQVGPTKVRIPSMSEPYRASRPTD